MTVTNELNMLSSDDAYSLALMLLYTVKDNPKYSTLSELSYLLDRKSFLNFIKYYEGQTITIPSFNSIKVMLRVILLYQYYKVQGRSWHESVKLAGFESDEVRSAERYLTQFIKMLETYKTGDTRDSDN